MEFSEDSKINLAYGQSINAISSSDELTLGGSITVQVPDNQTKQLVDSILRDKAFNLSIATGNLRGGFSEEAHIEGNWPCGTNISMIVDEDLFTRDVFGLFILVQVKCISFPWWGILLLALGIIVIVGAVVVVLVFRFKKKKTTFISQ